MGVGYDLELPRSSAHPYRKLACGTSSIHHMALETHGLRPV
jgi:hypothetical protein